MNWKLAEEQDALEKHITLTYTDYPDHHIGYYSNELYQYLTEQNSKTIPVTLELT